MCIIYIVLISYVLANFEVVFKGEFGGWNSYQNIFQLIRFNNYIIRYSMITV